MQWFSHVSVIGRQTELPWNLSILKYELLKSDVLKKY